MILRSFWKVILWLITITVLSCMPVHVIMKYPFLNIPNLDKAVHFFMYSFLSFFLIQGIVKYRPTDKHELFVIIALVISAAYGYLMEIAQLKLFTFREGDVIDMVFNITGTLAGIIFYEIIYPVVNKI